MSFKIQQQSGFIALLPLLVLSAVGSVAMSVTVVVLWRVYTAHSMNLVRSYQHIQGYACAHLASLRIVTTGRVAEHSEFVLDSAACEIRAVSAVGNEWLLELVVSGSKHSTDYMARISNQGDILVFDALPP